MAPPLTKDPRGSRSTGAGQSAALFCAGAWHLRHAPDEAPVAQEGLQGSRRRIGRVLAQAGLRCKTRRKFKAPTTAGQAQTVAPNQLNREFTVKGPDTVYVGDITYLPTGEGWLYLAVVLDLCSRAVVGWSMANHMRAELVKHALAMALGQWQPAAGLIMHTDRGSQYGAES